MLRLGARQHSQRHGWREGAEAGAAHRGGLHEEHPPHLPHQDAHDQAGAGQGPHPGGGELGPLLAQVQDQERETQEAARRALQGAIHALSPRKPRATQQGGQDAGVWRVFLDRGAEAAQGCRCTGGSSSHCHRCAPGAPRGAVRGARGRPGTHGHGRNQGCQAPA